ncbi:uncharacterized protein LOC111294599 isoform X2 [Durio zibethinus]|uniref:Uncharacterized protein LOC111294599 isoform X2 n=1 Tax=Durio zibethinus TaxID=66656 RepID=A0A6P5YT91_DURZI|nr:uncharacterized protein LOC111294599 isoform X2 [Durio zibethinus]
MRIRKRQVSLPFSSISPVPLSSDPNFNRSPVVQRPLQQQPPLPTPCFDPHPSDHLNHPIGQQLPTQGRDSSAFPGTTTTHHGQELKTKEDYLVLKQGGSGEKERGREGEKSNYTRKKSVLGAELGTGSLSQSSSSHQAVGSWGEGEKAFPLKKRRGSFERRGNDDDTIMEKDNYKKVMINSNKMKTMMNMEFVQQQNDNEQKEKEMIKDSASSAADNNHPSSAKKRGRAGALMEGSRCSRVNGRGWRCCQQTLVGYSLCEHHLGKGRLRSMTSVRSRSLASSNNAAKKEEQPNNDDHDQPISNYSSPPQQAKQTKQELLGQSSETGNDQEKEDQKTLMTTKKRVKLGMVKARSISSLLGQNDSAITVADDNK